MTKICLFITKFGDGGVERMLVNLARGLTSAGIAIDFIVNQAQVPYLHSLPKSVRLIEFGSSGKAEKERKLLRYLEQSQPDALISAKGEDDQIAINAKRKTGARTRFFLRPGTTVTARLDARKANPFKRWSTFRRMRWLYTQADGVLAVSRGVAEDIIEIAGIDSGKVHVVHNPNVTPDLYELAATPLDHPWFEPGEDPVVLGIGGLGQAKDFPTLIRAFALVNRERPARLIILGQGHMRDALVNLARELGVSDRVSLAGFIDNPYTYLSRAALFVLSSLWEGSPNVLVESLALGTPVVATNCRSGPSEITQQGKYGRLVEVGDCEAMSRAMLATLDHPPDGAWLKTAVADYTMEVSASNYLKAMGLEQPSASRNLQTETHYA